MRKNLTDLSAFVLSAMLVLALPPRGSKAASVSDAETPTAAPSTDLKAQKAREYFEKGNAYEDRGLSDQAREFWKMAHDLDPGLIEASRKLGEFSARTDAEKTSLKTISPNKTGDLKQQRFSDLLDNAQEAYNHKNYPETLKYLDIADRLYPDNPAAGNLRKLVDLENFQNEPDRPYNRLVRNFFEEAVEHHRHGRYTEALQSLAEAQNLDPGHSLVLRLRDRIESEYADAILSKDVERAKDQWKENNGEIAEEILENVLKKNPRFQPALELKSKILESAQTEEKSKLVPLLERARNAEKNDHFAGAKNAYERVLKIDPANQEARDGVERLTALVDPLQQKINDLKEALQANRKEQAERDLQGIKELSPNHPKIRYWIEQVAEMSAENTKDDSQAGADEAYNLGLESYRKGDLAGAKKFWSECVRLNPQYVQARRNLDRLIEENPQLK